MTELKPINGIHGTLVECFEEKQIQKVFDYMEELRSSKGFLKNDSPIYIGTNTRKGLYTLHSKEHSLAGETITFDEFINPEGLNSNELYKSLGMGILVEES